MVISGVMIPRTPVTAEFASKAAVDKTMVGMLTDSWTEVDDNDPDLLVKLDGIDITALLKPCESETPTETPTPTKIEAVEEVWTFGMVAMLEVRYEAEVLATANETKELTLVAPPLKETMAVAKAEAEAREAECNICCRIDWECRFSRLIHERTRAVASSSCSTSMSTESSELSRLT